MAAHYTSAVCEPRLISSQFPGCSDSGKLEDVTSLVAKCLNPGFLETLLLHHHSFSLGAIAKCVHLRLTCKVHKVSVHQNYKPPAHRLVYAQLWRDPQTHKIHPHSRVKSQL